MRQFFCGWDVSFTTPIYIDWKGGVLEPSCMKSPLKSRYCFGGLRVIPYVRLVRFGEQRY